MIVSQIAYTLSQAVPIIERAFYMGSIHRPNRYCNRYQCYNDVCPSSMPLCTRLMSVSVREKREVGLKLKLSISTKIASNLYRAYLFMGLHNMQSQQALMWRAFFARGKKTNGRRGTIQLEEGTDDKMAQLRFHLDIVKCADVCGFSTG